VNGQVVITGCVSGFADADGLVGNGCEVNLNTDPANCGSVGTAIPPNGALHANWGCVAGTVTLTSCVTGWGDANQQQADGCEVNLNTDPANCGSVGTAIPPSGYLHANWACSAGVITLSGCVSGWFNTNGSVVDGCETQADPDPSGNTQATAISLGSLDCIDSNTRTISGSIVSTLDNDWYVVHAAGGFVCFNDFGSDWFAPLTIAYDVITDQETRFNLTGDFTSGGGFYSDGTNVYIHVHQNGMNASNTYQLSFHL
jgi:hypothetical protein